MTVREIAKKLGVSPTAVSFVLNNRPGVGAENRARIREMLLANGYEIRQTKQAAPSKNIKFIKMRTSFQNDYFAVNILDAVERRATQLGYQISLTTITPDTDLSALLFKEREPVEGIIYLASSFTKKELKKTCRLPFPSVYIDFEEDPENLYRINTINADNYHASYLAVRHLYSLGHRRIGYIKSVQQLGCLNERFRYFKQHLSSLGLGLLPEHVLTVDLSKDDLEVQLWRKIKALRTMPTAFVAENDVVAVGLLYALLILDYRVPEDISIIGFDNSRISELIRPALSTMDVNVEELACTAVDRLIHLIQEPRAPIHVNVGVRLIKRESTAHIGESV